MVIAKKVGNYMKQVILVNGWLEMPPGKLAAQVSHASMVFLVRYIQSGSKVGNVVTINTDERMMNVHENWLEKSFTKLVLVARTKDEYDRVIKKLNKFNYINGIDYFEIIDKGLTVFGGVPTHTCTGFYPMEQNEINKFFGSLPLLE